MTGVTKISPFERGSKVNAPKKVIVLSAREEGVNVGESRLDGSFVHLFGDIRIVELVRELIEWRGPGRIAQRGPAHHRTNLQGDFLIQSGNLEDERASLRLRVHFD